MMYFTQQHPFFLHARFWMRTQTQYKIAFSSKRLSIFHKPLWFSNRGGEWHSPNLHTRVKLLSFHLEPPKAYFTLCNTQEVQSHKILVSEKQYSKDIIFLRKLLRNIHTCQMCFSAKIPKTYFPSQKTSHRTDPTGRIKSCNCSNQPPISCRNCGLCVEIAWHI